MTSKSYNFEIARQLAPDIKEESLQKEMLTCSIGISSNKLAAKIASDYQKPSGLTIIPPETIKEFFSLLSVRKLAGVGAKTERELNELGIHTIGELAHYNLQKLLSRFGRWGLYLHEAAEGIDESDVVEEYSIKSINRNSTFEEDTFDVTLMRKELFEMAEDIKRALDADNLSYKTVGIRLRYSGFETHTREKTLVQSEHSLEKIKETVEKLFSQHVDRKKKVRQVGVRVSNLSERNKTQITLDQFS